MLLAGKLVDHLVIPHHPQLGTGQPLQMATVGAERGDLLAQAGIDLFNLGELLLEIGLLIFEFENMENAAVAKQCKDENHGDDPERPPRNAAGRRNSRLWGLVAHREIGRLYLGEKPGQQNCVKYSPNIRK